MGILDEVKSVVGTIQKIDNIELYKQILDLQAEIMKLVEENSSLKGEIASLKDKFAVREQLIFAKNAYWLPAEGGRKTGPLCTNCWDVRRQVVRMHFDKETGYGQCPTCKVPVEIEPQDHMPMSGSDDEY